MRIAYLLPDTAIGGGVRVVFDQARALRDRGHDAVVVSPAPAPAWLEHRVPVLREIPEADVLVATFHTTVATAHACGLGLPVHLCQGYEGDHPHLRTDAPAIDAAYGLGVPVLTLHEALADRVRERHPDTDVRVVGQGVGRAFTPGVPHGGRRVLVPGIFEAEVKGVAVALEALALLERPVDLVRVSVLERTPEELAYDLGGEYHVGLDTAAMADLYRSCDVVLSASTSAEGYCLPVLEGLACGVPAVVTDVPCFRAYAPSLDWAASAAEGDTAGLSAALAAVLEDRDEACRLRARGLQVAATHDMGRVAERIEQALDGLLGRPVRPVAPTVGRVLHRRPAPDGQPEWAWGQETTRRTVGATARVVTDEPTVATLLETGGDVVLVVLDDTAHYPPSTWSSLVAALDDTVGVVVPATNESAVAGAVVPAPYAYSTPSLLDELAAERAAAHGTALRILDAVDPFAYAVARSDLVTLDPTLPAHAVPGAIARPPAVALGTYVHRWAAILDQPRPDLLAQVPSDAGVVLDVGCATGGFGATLKAARPDCTVVGLEVSAELAAQARRRLDRVVEADLEALPDDAFGPEFDVIVCGDVLEHVRDPWTAATRLAGWLAPGGRLVATVPHVGHWSIVRDLLHGRFEHVPYGLLCWSHLRYWTRANVDRLLDTAGLVAVRIDGYRDVSAPQGRAFIDGAVAQDPSVDADGLEIYEFLVVARRP